MKLGKYIQLLLPEHETVIIPGFGAFISTYKPAEIDKESGEIKPPSKEITFNQKIKNNDGLLVGAIAEKEGFSHYEALQKIEDERENILYRLDKGEKITLEKIGELQYGNQHTIQFNPFDVGNLLLDAYGLETASPTKEIPDDSEEEPEEYNEDKKLLEFVAAVKNHPFEKETIEKDPPSEGVKEPEPAMEEKRAEKKNRSWLWFLLILLPLIGVGLFMIRKKNEEKSPVQSMNEKPAITDIAPDKAEPVPLADTIKPDSAAATFEEDSVELQEEHTDPVKFVKPDPSKYYLVAGSFKEKENAYKFFAQLEHDGFAPFHLGKQGNFYIIGIGVYNSEQEAFDAQDVFLEENPESRVWIYQVE